VFQNFAHQSTDFDAPKVATAWDHRCLGYLITPPDAARGEPFLPDDPLLHLCTKIWTLKSPLKYFLSTVKVHLKYYFNLSKVSSRHR